MHTLSIFVVPISQVYNWLPESSFPFFIHFIAPYTFPLLPHFSPWPSARCAPRWCLYKSIDTQWPVLSDPACELDPWPADPLWDSSHYRRKLPVRAFFEKSYKYKKLNPSCYLKRLSELALLFLKQRLINVLLFKWVRLLIHGHSLLWLPFCGMACLMRSGGLPSPPFQRMYTIVIIQEGTFKLITLWWQSRTPL